MPSTSNDSSNFHQPNKSSIISVNNEPVWEGLGLEMETVHENNKELLSTTQS